MSDPSIATGTPALAGIEIRDVAQSRGLSADELDIRLEADSSSRTPVLVLYAIAVFWLLFASVFGELASFKLHWPDLMTEQAWLTFGRVRTYHLHSANYGWATAGLMATCLWLTPRLMHTTLRGATMALWGGLIFNVGVMIGIVGVALGYNDGMEWLEAGRYTAGPFLVLGGAMVGLSLFRTLAARKAEHLYVSVWYILGAFIWFPMLYVTGKWPTWSGVESAAVNWFFGHNVLGFWLTAMSLGAAYYFIPKVLGRPIYSYHLSLLGFWSLAMFYSLNGMHHLVGGPLPTWMITTSIVASVFMFIPVAATGINLHMTVVGRFGALRYSPTLRFIVIGAIAYTAVSLQGSFTALREVSRITHFTHWTVAHSHVGNYLFVSFIVFGAMYYVIPRLVRHEWPSEKLINWHFYTVFAGIAIYVLGLTWAGVSQGLALLDAQLPFQVSTERSMIGLQARSVGGLILTAGHLIFAWHFWLMLRGSDQKRQRPAFHDTQPVLYTAQASQVRQEGTS